MFSLCAESSRVAQPTVIVGVKTPGKSSSTAWMLRLTSHAHKPSAVTCVVSAGETDLSLREVDATLVL
jgi:hypothetical protein